MQALQWRAMLAFSLNGEPHVTRIVLWWGVKCKQMRNKLPIPRGCWANVSMASSSTPPDAYASSAPRGVSLLGWKNAWQAASFPPSSGLLGMTQQYWKRVPLILQGWSVSSRIHNSMHWSLKKSGCHRNHLKACFKIFATYSKATIISCCQITTALQKSLGIFFNHQGRNSHVVLLSRQRTEFWSGILSL